MSLRVLVVDDSILFRRVLGEALAAIPGVEVVGSAANGKAALQRARELRPDVITLDLEMPELDGLAVLTGLRQAGDPAKVLVISALTARGGQLTMRALQLGAFDFITKPDGDSREESRARIGQELAQRMRVLLQQQEVRHILRGAKADAPAPRPAPQPQPRSAVPTAPEAPPEAIPAPRAAAAMARCELLLIGASTGGPQALARLLPALPADLGVPVLLVQHMPPLFTASMATSLAGQCALRVKEAEHGEVAQPNVVYIAPGGRHMRLVRGAEEQKLVQITDDPPENNCRPSVDYLFRSVSLHFGGRAVAAILTGMGSDGALGLRLLKRHGCLAYAQDEATSVVYGMAKAAVEAGVIDEILPLEEMGGRLAAAVRARR